MVEVENSNNYNESNHVKITESMKYIKLILKIKFKIIMVITIVKNGSSWRQHTACRWQMTILGITWKDKIINEEIRRKTWMEKLEKMMRKKRLRRGEEDRI